MSIEAVETKGSAGAAEEVALARTAMNWYALQIVPGRESKVEQSLRERIVEVADNIGDDFGELFMPTEEMIERKNGKEQVSQRKFFPNYMFIEMRMTPRTWHLVTRLPLIKGFVGDPNKRRGLQQRGNWREPPPIPNLEMHKLRSRVLEGSDKPRMKIEFSKGEQVRIKAGPFTDFNGEVTSVNFEQNRITVLVQVFSKATPVEIDFEQVEKM